MKLEINHSISVQLRKAIAQLMAEREALRFDLHKIDIQLEQLIKEFKAQGNTLEFTTNDERGRFSSEDLTTLLTL